MKNILAIIIVTGLIISGIVFIRFKTRPKNDINETRKMIEENIRQPAVAGTFYPADPTELRKKIDNLLSSSKDQMDNDEMVKLLIVPHAGYDYSGSVAAAGFKQIKGLDYDTVILLGASHQAYFKGVAVDENTVWKTPLGQVDIDLVTAQKIVDSSDNFNFNSQAHEQEHSLEVELPFLQTVLDDFKIVPILFGQADNQTIEELSSTIHKHLTPNTLIIVSTDLSHYPSYDIANSVDERTINAILTGDPDEFEQTVNDQLAQNYPNLDTCACGEKAVKVGMRVAEKLKERGLKSANTSGVANFSSRSDSGWKLLKYANSGDAVGEKSRVVGYAAILYSIPSNVEGSLSGQSRESDSSTNGRNKLEKEQKNKLLQIARETLETYIKNSKKPTFDVSDQTLQKKLGVFVTLRKNGKLRGCMGKFEPNIPLWQTVIDRTIAAATKDPRFRPVKLNEINDISIEISVLSKPEPIDSWKKIELGTHGVLVKKGNHGGTYLPQVGAENDWEGVEDFLSHLCQNKAGLPKNCYKDPSVDLLTYTADVFSE